MLMSIFISVIILYMENVQLRKVSIMNKLRSSNKKLSIFLFIGLLIFSIESFAALTHQVTQLSINTYAYENALVTASYPAYPYHTLDFGRVGSPSARNHTAIVMENDWTKIVVLPNLGGRIYKCINKKTGSNEFYENCIKPNHFGLLGWWLATGGSEFAFPVQEHGYIFYDAFNYNITDEGSSITLTMTYTEKTTNLNMEIKIKMYSDRSYYEVYQSFTNNTGSSKNYMYWINTMTAPGPGNITSEYVNLDMKFSTTRMIVHNNMEPKLGTEGTVINWPIHYASGDPYDLSKYSEYVGSGHTIAGAGLFADNTIGSCMGIYNTDSNEGVIRIFNQSVDYGQKLWCFGKSASNYYGDYSCRGSYETYVEMMGAPNKTFFDYSIRSLPNTQKVQWTDYFYPLQGIGTFDETTSNKDVAFNFQLPGSLSAGTSVSVPLNLFATRPDSQCTLVFEINNVLSCKHIINISPSNPFTGSLPINTTVAGGGNNSNVKLSVFFTGDATASATITKQANIPICSPILPTPTPNTCDPMGDVDCNGSISPGDALKCFQIFLEIYIPTGEEPCDVLCIADPDENGSVTPGDALCIFNIYMERPCN